MTLTFAGLIRAHGDGGTGGTTIDPKNTYVTTNSGTTTTFDLEGTYVTTIGHSTTFDVEATYQTTTYDNTTTWDPEETVTTTPPTTISHYDINELAVFANSAAIPPAPKPIVFAGQYGESDQHIVDIDYGTLEMPVGSCDVRLRLKAWVDPDASPHNTSSRIIVRAEIYGLLYDHISGTPLHTSFIKGSDKRVLVGNCDNTTGIITPSWGSEPEPTPDPHPYGVPPNEITFGPGSFSGVQRAPNNYVEFIDIRVLIGISPVLPAPSNSIIVNGQMAAIIKWSGYEYVPPSVTPPSAGSWNHVTSKTVGHNPPIPFTLKMTSHLH
jgi:hypothetical protein